jgi:hypothetical protein
VRVVLAAALLAAACVHPRPRAPDEPYRIADEEDFGLLLDRAWAMSPGRDHDATRAELAGAFVERAKAHLDRGGLELAHEDLLAVADLYGGDPDAIGPVRAPHTAAGADNEGPVAGAGAARESATTRRTPLR